MAVITPSLLNLPGELLFTILSLAQVPPCEISSVKKRSISPLLHVSKRLRSLSFELFTRKHTVLSLRSFKDRYSNLIPGNPTSRFIEDVSHHLVEIPCHWRSIHPCRPAVLRFDVDLGTNLRDFAYLLERNERNFICTTHGLTSLLHMYHRPEYSQLKLSLKVIDASTRSQLFITILEWFEIPSALASSTSLNVATRETYSEPSVSIGQHIREIGRPLLEGETNKFANIAKHTLELTRSCIRNNDFESAISIVLHFGLPLLNQLPTVAPRWLSINASRSAFPELAQPDWKTNTRLALMFEITRLATQVLCCAYLAWCICVQEGDLNWVRAHPSAIDQHFHIEQFGMSAREIAEFDFIVVLQWVYECKLRDYTTECPEMIQQLLKQLREAYQAGGCQPIYARAYTHVATCLSTDPDVQISQAENDLDSGPIEYIDADGIAQIWNGTVEDWNSWQMPLLDDQNEPRRLYLARAQNLFHRGECFEDLTISFLQRFCETNAKGQ